MHTSVQALVLEGKTDLANKVAVHLDHLGYEVSGFLSHAEEAIALCRSDLPDLLVAGTHLSGLLGHEAGIRIIREQINVPIVYLEEREERDGAIVPVEFDRLDLARGIAHAFGAGLPQQHFDPTQDFILHDRILLRFQERMIRILVRDILYVGARRNYTSVRLEDGEYLLSMSIDEVEHRLGMFGFLRVHRSYLVNSLHLREAQADSLRLGHLTVPIGRGYRKLVRQYVKGLHRDRVS